MQPVNTRPFNIVPELYLAKSYPWITTVFVLWMVGSGLGAFLNLEFMASAIESLGYPHYFHLMLGTAKLLGAGVIILRVSRTLREWAYAGVVFETICATTSYAVTGAAVGDIMAPLMMLVLTVIAYASWRLHIRQEP